jgi:endonuclease/exonuclease/phosphatase family metal-dependent hydrolase
VGPAGSPQFDAAAEVLRRIGPDIVGIQEVDGGGDVTNLIALANQLGYVEVVIAGPSPFGTLRNAVLSKHPVLSERVITAQNTSGDPNANDITRFFVEAVVDVGAANPVAVVSGHWKAGSANDDEFRRAVEAFRVRVGSLAVHDPSQDPLFVLGDVNEDIDDPAPFPATFFSLPSGLPGSFALGADARSLMTSTGIVNTPFHYLTDPAELSLTTLPALQLDGRDATRPASGRRLDYIFYSGAITTPPMGEVYDSLDEVIGGGLPKFDPAPAPTVSASSSDHLLVFADVELPSACYPDCDTTTGVGVLDIFDFLCFQDAFTSGDPYACECDVTAGSAACDIFDFLCFQDAFTTGCS